MGEIEHKQSIFGGGMSVPLGTLMGNGFAIVSGRTNPALVNSIAEYLAVKPVFLQTGNWGNGYPRCKRREEDKDVTFSGKKVIIITSLQYRGIGSPVEELELMVDACGSADEIHVILTWLCGKDDVQHGSEHTPTIAWMAHRIAGLNPTSVNLFDPHQSGHTELFYPVKRRRFYLLRLLIEKAREMSIDQIAATDFSSTKRAKKVESFLGTGQPIFLASKEHHHQAAGSPLAELDLRGRLVGEKIGVFDDMALSWNTMRKVVESLKMDFGAKEVHAFAPHFDPTPETFDNLQLAFQNNWLTSFTTTNSNQIDARYLELPGFTVVDISKFVAQVVELLILKKSTSNLFDDI
ncbi:MAG: ribose-phosphate pyrophosphokinase-like domain-containing protein [Candidatus Komeilibacteria bacterium]|nr:ribose-phosphate pyrophosphokinase-like domain-containing protein [Candidatus Komeilibacteria bacterium]